MCGIVGAVLSKPGSIIENLIGPLQRLEYRGYDSCGAYTTDLNGGESYCREVGDVQNLIKNNKRIYSETPFIQGIAHTRWATHGAVSTENSHPQSSSQRIFVVHNGVIDNYHEIKASLVLKGYIFDSDTDTEVIAHLIHSYVDGLGVEYPTSTAVCMAMMDLKGKFSFIMIDKETETLVAVNNGRPLIIFKTLEDTFISSDVSSFQGKGAGKVYHLIQGDVIEMNGSLQKVRRVRLAGGRRVQEKIVEGFDNYVSEDLEKVSSMRTVMETEIHQQPTAIKNTLELDRHSVISSVLSQQLLVNPEHVRKIKLIGCGTSYHAALMGVKWLKSLADVDATAHISSEFSNVSVIDNETSLFIFISQSGETADTLSALASVNSYAPHKTLAICNVAQSELVRSCKYQVLTRAGTERSVASTKAFTSQLAALLKLSISIGNVTKRGMGSISFIMSDLEREMDKLEAEVSQTIKTASLEVREMITSWSGKAPSQAIFLARDILYPIALEGALKLAEIAYVPSLTYFTGELKHGPLALVDERTPIFVIFSSNEANLKKIFSSLNQVQARHGRIYLISDERGIELAGEAGIKPLKSFTLPTVTRYENVLLPILATVPLQLIAHEIALKLGRNVDRPRSLAKSVTVE